MISIYPSEEGFDELFQLANDIAVLTNPQLFYHMKDIPIVERLTELQRLKDEMGEKIA